MYNTYRDMRVPSTPLGISGWEDSVDQDKGANNLGAQAVALAVSRANGIRSAIVGHVEALLEAFDNTSAANSA